MSKASTMSMAMNTGQPVASPRIPPRPSARANTAMNPVICGKRRWR